MKFKDYLNEDSYTQKDIPEYFYVVFDLRDSFESLNNMKFENMKGISDKNEIQFQFLGVARDAMLKMDSKKLMDINSLTRINYDNPHYLVSKNMWSLRRLFNAGQKRWVDQVFGNLFQYLTQEMKKSGKYRNFTYEADYAGFRNVDYDWVKKNEGTLNIKNLKDLSKIVKYYIDNIFTAKSGVRKTWDDITESEIYKLLFSTLREIGRIYHDEGEWVIKNSYLKIPKNSELVVLTPHFENYDQKIYDEFVKWANESGKDVEKLGIGFDIIKFYILVKEKYGDDAFGKDSGNLYLDLAKVNKYTDRLESKYKVVKLDHIEFKKSQSEYHKRMM